MPTAGNLIDRYLVSIGFDVDKEGQRLFNKAIGQAEDTINTATSGIFGKVASWGTAVVGAFAGMSAATLGFADHIAQQDQQFRLFGLSMFMTADSARKLKIALDAVGAPLGVIAWDKELQGRLQAQMSLIDQAEKQLKVNTEESLQSIRDIHAEFGLLGTISYYGSIKLVAEMFQSLGINMDDVRQHFAEFNSYLVGHLPEITKEIGGFLVPVLKDTWVIMKDLWGVSKAAAAAFTNFVGELSGDDQIKGTTVSLAHFAQAIQHVVSGAAKATTWIFEMAESVIHLADASESFFAIAFHPSDIGGAWDRLKHAKDELHLARESFSKANGPAGDLAVAAASGNVAETFAAAMKLAKNDWTGEIDSAQQKSLAELIAGNLKGMGIGGFGAPVESGGVNESALFKSVAMSESQNRQYDEYGHVIVATKNADPNKNGIGVMQLTPPTAAALGVNPFDEAQNRAGGEKYLRQLFSKYQDWFLALEAYNWGPANLDKALRRGTGVPYDVQQYATGILSRQGVVINGGVTFHIDQPKASPEQLQRHFEKAMSNLNKRRSMEVAQVSPY